MLIKTRVQVGKAQKYIAEVKRSIPNASKEAVEEASKRFTAYVKNKYLSGGPGGLQIRSGKLYKHTVPRPVRKYRDAYIGGVIIGNTKATQKYAGVHFSDHPTVILPRKDYLTIPIKGSPAVDSRGVQTMRARDIRRGARFWIEPGTGLVLGRQWGQTRTPYFKLVRSATIYPVVSPQVLANNYAMGFRSIVTSYVKKTLREQFQWRV